MRSEFVVNKLEGDIWRKWLGSRPCYWLTNRQISRSWTAKRCASLHVLEKLNRGFAVVHVHGNNTRPWDDLGGVPFPQLLEVTYASRKRYKFEPNHEVFPTWLDAPNDPNKPDMFLGRFVFPERHLRESLTLVEVGS
jgi:hypothetical protein